MSDTSFPYLAIARRHGVAYGDVVRFAEFDGPAEADSLRFGDFEMPRWKRDVCEAYVKEWCRRDRI